MRILAIGRVTHRTVASDGPRVASHGPLVAGRRRPTGDASECSGYHRPTMTDQLSLRLEPAMPRLPADLRPMLPRSAQVPFDSADHLFEPSWGGERVLAFIEPADRAPLRLLDGHGRDLAALVPELADLPTRILARSAVVDGELVVVDAAGHADPLGLDARLRGEPGPPVAYLVFDLIVLDGRPLLREPLVRRRQMLRRTLTPGDAVVAVPAISGEGLALHAAVRAQGIGAVLARVRSSPYLPGTRSRLWRLIEATPIDERSPIASGEDPGALDGQASFGLAGDGRSDPNGRATAAGPGGTSSPVLALIRRLPFDEGA
jgi:ATP dependent DNA ligase domain